MGQDGLILHLSPPSLRQGCLHLREPEGHAHSAVHLNGRRQFSAGLLQLPIVEVQYAETPVAVGLERAHAELFGQGKGLTVVGFGLRDVWGIAPRRNIAEEAQGIRLMAAFLVLTSQRQRALGEGVCLLQTASRDLRLPQGETTERLISLPFPLP